MNACGCCGTTLIGSGTCPLCDASPTFTRLHDDHETAWRLDRLDGSAQEGMGP